MKETLVVIGLGQLGFRHVQSLMEMQSEYMIYGFEINNERIDEIREQLEGVELVHEIDALPDEIKLCIIATGADVRFAVFKNLVERKCVKYILFEKILFQRKWEYMEAWEVLRKKGIKAYVNCVRREWDSYLWVQEELKNSKKITYTVTGGDWGLCCNGIHMIDLLLFLTGETDFHIDNSKIDKEIVESKRKGFYELYGTIRGRTRKCSSFEISSLKDSSSPSLVLVTSDICNLMIDEENKQVFVSSKKNGWRWEKREFICPYQSQLSAKEARRIFSGECLLTTYDDAMYTHLKYLDSIQYFFIENGWEDEEICPIT